MYLTRCHLNQARRGTRHLLQSPQAMHAAVLAAFPPGSSEGEEGRTLWRVDRSAEHAIAVYLVSEDSPDLTHLVEQAGWPTKTAGWHTREYGSFLSSLDRGSQWAFRLTANPVRSGRLATGAPRTQRFGHVTVTQQRDWLLSRAERCGFEVPTGASGEPDVIVRERLTQRFKRQGRDVTLSLATYDGRLVVTDPDALRRTLSSGLGHAKAYGCGLMTLAPVR